MNDYKNIQVGDILTFKKNHPCGGSDWRVLRIGIDFKFLEVIKVDIKLETPSKQSLIGGSNKVEGNLINCN